MKALALDPNGYAGTYKLIGGRVALDFVNTISWPGTERAHDWLTTVDNLEDWCGAVDLDHAPLTTDDLDPVRELRTDLANVLRPVTHSREPDKKAVEVLTELLHAAHHVHRIDPDTLSLVLADASTIVDAFAPVVLDAADIIVNARHHDRLRYCPSCDWLFEDQTRNGRRRWCDMADCGSRAKSRAYYQRTTQPKPANH